MAKKENASNGIAVKMQIGRKESIIKQNVQNDEDYKNILESLKKDNDNDYLNALNDYVTDNKLKGKRKSKKDKKVNTSDEVIKTETNDEKIKKIIASGATETDMITMIKEIYNKEERRKDIENKIKNLNDKKSKIEGEISKLPEELKGL